MGVLEGFPADAGSADFLPGAEQPVEETGFLANFKAGYRAGRAGPGTVLHQWTYEKPYMDQIVGALNARGETTTDPILNNTARSRPRQFRNPFTGSIPLTAMNNPLAWQETEWANIWSAVQKRRESDPGFLKDLPDAATLRERALADRRRTLAESGEVQGRAGTFGTIGGFLGGLLSGAQDPESYAGGVGSGAASKTFGRQILKNAGIAAAENTVVGGLMEPFYQEDAKVLGIERTATDVAQDLGMQAAFGGIMGAGGVIVPRAGAAVGRRASALASSALSNLPAPVRDAVTAASIRAGTVQDRAMTAEVRRALNPFSAESRATPDEQAAIHVVERDADVREANPLPPGPVGDTAHENRLGAMMQALGVAERPPVMPSPAPLPARPAGGLVAAINKAEGIGRNPMSSASGVGQFLTSTWLDLYKRKFGAGGLTDAQILARRDEPELGRQMTAAYAEENARGLRRAGLEDSAGNLSLAHFLGLGGARDVLRADPDRLASDILPAKVIAANERVLKGKTAAQVIAWAHKRIGNAVGEPVARPDAVPDFDADADLIGGDGPAIQSGRYTPAELEADAGLMQYKSGGDDQGVTDRLAGITEWNPILSGKVVVWEAADGRRIIADGHQRLGLAKRLQAENPDAPIYLDAVTLREVDGVTAQDARVAGALKNIAEGTGSAVDAARVLREAPEQFQLPPRSPLVRAAKGLSALSNDAFGAVLNDVIDADLAGAIGRALPDSPDLHMPMVKVVLDSGVTTAAQADSVIRQAAADGFGVAREEQLGMFGDDQQTSLYGPSARVLDAAKRRLRSDKKVFKTLTGEAGRIEAAGNKLDRKANQAKVQGNDEAIGLIEATAYRIGPVRDALLDAARRALDGDQPGAVRQFLDALDGIDLRAAAAGLGESERAGGAPDGGGRAIDDPEADPLLADGRGLPGGPSAYDDAVAAGQAGLGFDDPVAGPSVAPQVQSLEHDVMMEAGDRSFRLSEDGDEASAATILSDANSDLSAAEAARACLVPPVEEA